MPPSTANWWAHATKQTRAAAHRKTRLATALGSGAFEPVRVALAEGRLLVDQAQVIVAAVEALPADLDDRIRVDAQVSLVGYAVHHDARELRILGNRILEVVAPEVGEAHEAKQLAAEEREAEAAASFRMVEDGHGRCHGRFTISSLHGAMLRKQLLAIAAPKHRARVDGQAPEPGRPSAHRLGEAFAEYIETYPTDRLPQYRWRLGHGGGDHDRGHPDGRVEGSGVGHRPPDQPRPGPEARLPGRDHPRRPRHPVPSPRPGSEDPVPHRTPADRPGPGTGRLHRGGL